jgi:hypothetical protein
MAAVPPPAVPVVTQQSVLRYRGSPPINFRLLLVNTVLIGGCSYVIYASIVRYYQALSDFDNVARTSPVGVAPCGLAVPRTKFMLESLNEISDGAFAEVDESAYVERVRGALCAATQPVDALRAGLQAAEIEAYSDDGASAHASVDAYVCSCKDASCNANAYGDFKRRLAHAYVLAAPAFAVHNKAGTGSCLGANSPFPTDTQCPSASTVSTQLDAAATDTIGLLTGTATNYPETYLMLYRLLALSVAEYYDRTSNNGGCFKNGNAAANALTFCTSALSGVTGATGGSAAATPATQAYYANLKTAAACGYEANDQTATPPDMPGERDRKFTADYATTQPALAICASMLEFGWLGRKRLFGLPDPVAEAEWFSEHAGSSFSRWLAGWTYYGVFDRNKGRAETGTAHTGYLDLKLYVGYKYASTTAWVLAACIAAGYLLSFALVPFIKVVYIRLVRRAVTNTRTDTILSRPLGTGGFIALFTTIVVGLWIIFVDGGMNVPYATTTTCTDYRAAGGPFVTTDERAPDGLLGLILLILGTGVLLYMSFCRKPPREQRIIPLNPFPIWPLFALIVIVLVAVIILMVVAGDDWWVKESTNIGGATSKLTQDFEEIIFAALWALLLLALLTGLLAQRHMAANTLLNVPRGRLPTFAYAWAGGGLALAVGAAVLLWPLFDCSLQVESNEIICGNDVEYKVRWERFWGCVAWFASLVAILFVVFAVYRTVLNTPRRSDAASQAFNRSKDAEIRLLAERRNQRRFGTTPASLPAAPVGGLAAPTGAAFDLSDYDDDDADSLDLEGTEGTLPPAQATANRISFKLPLLGGAPQTGGAPARAVGTVPAAFVVAPSGVTHAC